LSNTEVLNIVNDVMHNLEVDGKFLVSYDTNLKEHKVWGTIDGHKFQFVVPTRGDISAVAEAELLQALAP